MLTFASSDEEIPYFRAIEENEGPVVQIEGRKVIMAGANNYLGLTADPRVKEAAIHAIGRASHGQAPKAP